MQGGALSCAGKPGTRSSLQLGTSAARRPLPLKAEKPRGPAQKGGLDTSPSLPPHLASPARSLPNADRPEAVALVHMVGGGVCGCDWKVSPQRFLGWQLGAQCGGIGRWTFKRQGLDKIMRSICVLAQEGSTAVLAGPWRALLIGYYERERLAAPYCLTSSLTMIAPAVLP